MSASLNRDVQFFHPHKDVLEYILTALNHRPPTYRKAKKRTTPKKKKLTFFAQIRTALLVS